MFILLLQVKNVNVSFFPLHLLSLLLCTLQIILSPCCGTAAAPVCEYNPACSTRVPASNTAGALGEERAVSEGSEEPNSPRQSHTPGVSGSQCQVPPAHAQGAGQAPCSSSAAIPAVNAEPESQSGAMEGEAGLVGNHEKH